MSTDPLSGIELTSSVSAALELAVRATSRGEPVNTRTILTALIACDRSGYWSQFIIDESAMSFERTDAVGRSYREVPLTEACAGALAFASHLASTYGMLPMPPGVLALGLIADPLSDAALSFVGLSHVEITTQIQEQILGTELIDQSSLALMQSHLVAEETLTVAPVPDDGEEREAFEAHFRADKFYLLTLGWTMLSLALFAGEIAVPLKNITPYCPNLTRFTTETIPCNQAAAHEFGRYALRILLGFLPIYFSASVVGKLRRRQWREVPSDQTELLQQIGLLAAEMNIAAPTTVLTQAGTRIASLKGRYVLALNNQTAARASMGDLSRLRAICRHELAHIVNRDFTSYRLAKTFRAGNRGVWILTVLLVQIRLTPDHGFAATWRVSLIFVAAELAAREFLRSLEYYADLRAAYFDDATVNHLLTTSHAPKWRLLAALSWHPTESQRRRVLEDPSRLNRLHYRRLAAIGFLSGSASPVVFIVLKQLGAFGLGRVGISILACLLVVLPVGLAIAKMAWSDALLSFRDRRRPTAIVPACVFSISTVAGMACSPLSSTGIAPAELVHVLGLGVPTLVIAFGAWIVFTWQTDVAYVCYRVNLDDVPPARLPSVPFWSRPVSGLALAVVSSIGWEAVLLYNDASRSQLGDRDVYAAVSSVNQFVLQPIVGIVIVLAWFVVLGEPKTFQDTLLGNRLRDRCDTRGMRWPRAKLINRVSLVLALSVSGLVLGVLNRGHLQQPLYFAHNYVGAGFIVTLALSALAAFGLTCLMPRGVRGSAIMAGAFGAGVLSALTLKLTLAAPIPWGKSLEVGLVGMQAASVVGIALGSAATSLVRGLRPRRPRSDGGS